MILTALTLITYSGCNLLSCGCEDSLNPAIDSHHLRSEVWQSKWGVLIGDDNEMK